MKQIKWRMWCGILMLIIMAVPVYAFNQYLVDFNNQYGTAGTVLNTCALCHPGNNTGNLNNYALNYATAGHLFSPIENLDSDNDGFTNIQEITARTFPGDATSFPVVADTIAPTVTAFVIPATSSSLTVTITTFTATDNVAVTGYLLTETASPPAAGAAGWSATPPGSYTFATEGSKTLYAWAKDAASNVSASLNASVVIALPAGADTEAPTVTAFVIPATSSSLAVTITTFTATDNVAVTGYLLTETASAPAAGAAGWSGTQPASYTFATEGSKTLYAWAKDATGNVSLSLSASVVITLPVGADTIAPTVTAFVIPATSSSLTVTITTFTATDNVAVTGYLLTETAAAPNAGAAGWSSTPPVGHVFATEGSKTLYAWAKDAAGNVSASLSASVSITLSQTVSSGDGDGGCFIATAAFGSPLDPYVAILREFRDTFLVPTTVGRNFVNFYYRTSPKIAEQVAANPFLKVIVQIILLPVIGFSFLALRADLATAMMLSALLLGSIGVFGRWCFKRRRRV